MAVVEVTLPTGIWREGTPHRRARLSWPDEGGERELVEAGRHLLPAERVTQLVACCVELEGESGEPLARELTAGDRVALVLQLRRLACGEALRCVTACPNPDCGQQLELELRVADLLVDPDEISAVEVHAVAGTGLAFRLPTGADEEKAARNAVSDLAAAIDELVADCLVDSPADRTHDTAAAVAAAMAEADPQAELIIELTCPECGESRPRGFDPGGYLFAELEDRVETLEREIHGLARGYGWSEEQILALPKARRQRYLTLIQTGAA
jgi:hypothetical protein